ncbi:MAG: O-antigen ligase family protein [Microbacterium sp.]|uniref:O-antigen ligase family protein n=1 Tax=Microbacterium sp. TaxID=51671 RepID=UPI003BAE50CD
MNLDPALLLLIGAAAIIVLLVILLIPLKRVWQLYALVASVNPSPVALPASSSGIFALAAILRDPIGAARSLSKPLPSLLLLLTFTYVVSLIWSPKPSAGLAVVLTTTTVVAAVTLAIRAAVSLRSETASSDLWALTAIATAPLAIVQSVSTIVFRFDIALEDRYLRSSVIGFLLGDEGRLLFTSMANNVVDPLKSGGLLFVNGNKASMVMAVWALVYLSVWLRRRRVMYVLLFAVCMAGALSTSSKTAVFLAVSIVPVFLLLPSVLRVRSSPMTAFLGLIALVTVACTLAAVVAALSDLLTGVDESAKDRESLWSAAGGYFSDSPILGLGAGGWDERWAQDASTHGLGVLPPHNLFIVAWANGGLLAAAVIAIIVIYIARRYLGLITRAGASSDARASSIELAALVWMIAHGMFDNTDFFGAPQSLPVFAAICMTATVAGASRPPEPVGPMLTPSGESSRRVQE